MQFHHIHFLLFFFAFFFFCFFVFFCAFVPLCLLCLYLTKHNFPTIMFFQFHFIQKGRRPTPRKGGGGLQQHPKEGRYQATRSEGGNAPSQKKEGQTRRMHSAPPTRGEGETQHHPQDRGRHHLLKRRRREKQHHTKGRTREHHTRGNSFTPKKSRTKGGDGGKQHHPEGEGEPPPHFSHGRVHARAQCEHTAIIKKHRHRIRCRSPTQGLLTYNGSQKQMQPFILETGTRGNCKELQHTRIVRTHEPEDCNNIAKPQKTEHVTRALLQRARQEGESSPLCKNTVSDEERLTDD